MPNSTPLKRAWITTIPTPDGPIRMIGYGTGLHDCWHLAFVKSSCECGSEVPRLWVIPARSCACLSNNYPPENMSVLTGEFRRFASSRHGIAILLFQHPRNFGSLLLGEDEGNALAFLASACGSSAAETKRTQGSDHQCLIREILQEIGIDDISLEYPPVPEMQYKFASRCAGVSGDLGSAREMGSTELKISNFESKNHRHIS